MKRIFITWAAVFLTVSSAWSQHTQADIDKLQQQLQERLAKRGKDTSGNKMMQNLQDQQKQVMEAMKNRPAGNSGNNAGAQPAGYDGSGEAGNVDSWKFPARKMALLAALPKKVFVRTEMVAFLNDLYMQVSKRMAPGIAASVQSIAAKYGNDGHKMENAALYGWFTKYREEAFLLMIRAAQVSPDDGLLLNNCAAILNMGGLEERAIPILRYILQSYPSNGMVLNNMGQAYAGLGETDTAMVYLGRAIRAVPTDPEANNTAGQIEAARGNTGKAAEYFEQSIKGAYNKPAALMLRKIKKESKLAPLVRPRIKLPEYFNQFKYRLPAQCTSTDNAEVAQAEHRAFRNMISGQMKVFGNQMEAVQKAKYSEAMKVMQGGPNTLNIRKDDFIAQPYHDLCGTMANEVTAEYGADLINIMGRADTKYEEETKTLENEYQVKLKALKDGYVEKENRCCGEGRSGSCCPTAEEKCTAYNGLANQYLPKFAALTEEWQKKNQLVFSMHYDEVMYWGYLYYHPSGDDNFRLTVFYPVVLHYLNMLYKIGTSRIIEPCLAEPTTATADSNAIKEMDCPVDLKIPFGIAKMTLNCKKFSVSGGEGAVFGYERDFETHQSTISVGIGFDLELAVKAGPLKAGVSAGLTETAFITFDGRNGLSDAGLKNEASASGGATGLGKEEISIGSTIGIRSGWNFNEGEITGGFGLGKK